MANILLIAWCFIALYRTFCYLRTMFWLKKCNSAKILQLSHSAPVAKKPYLLIIIPALREQSQVASAIEHFKSFIYDPEKLFIVFVTTDKEHQQKANRKKMLLSNLHRHINKDFSKACLYRNNNGTFPTKYLDSIWEQLRSCPKSQRLSCLERCYDETPSTQELISCHLAKLDCQNQTMRHVNYPYTHGGKPSQLNYVFANYKTLFPELAKVPSTDIYIGLYDFDSKPDIRTGEYVAGCLLAADSVMTPRPVMLQQTQIPLNEFSKYPGSTLNKALLYGNSVLYLRRALGIELHKIRKLNAVNALASPMFRALSRPVVYGIGAGLYIQAQMLERIGGFQEPQEDLVLGYQMCLTGHNICEIPLMNYMEPYTSIGSMTNAFSNAFSSAISIYRVKKTCNIIPHQIPITTYEQDSLITKEWVECFLWVAAFPLYLTSLIYLYFCNLNSFLAFLVCTVLCRCIIDAILLTHIESALYKDYQGTTLQKSKLPWWFFLIMVLISPVHEFIRIIPPLKYFVRTIIRILFNKHSDRTKTER